ncbi:hypothetical protein KCU81_g4247, partial [Aureobasidium melanogenum]
LPTIKQIFEHKRPTKACTSDNKMEAKTLRERIKHLNRSLRFRVNGSYVSNEEYRSDTLAGLTQKLSGLVGEREDLKDKNLRLEGQKLDLERQKLKLQNEKLVLVKENAELGRQKQDLKAKNLDLKVAYYALRHGDENGDGESLCFDHCCRPPGEDSSDEDGSDENGSNKDSSGEDSSEEH